MTDPQHWARITRDSDLDPVTATGPEKIADAIEDFSTQVVNALRSDGMDFGLVHEAVEALTVTVTDLTRGTNDRLVGEWEQVLDNVERLRGRE